MRRSVYGALALALPFALAAQIQPAQSAPEPGITRQQADEILTELRQIRQLLERQGQAEAKGPAEPAHARINLEGAEMLGAKTAPLTIVEFTDYQCPFCQRFHVNVFGDLKKEYIDTGKVRFYSRDLPLDSIHPNAHRAAEAARCAADQHQFWAIRDKMGSHPNQLDLDSLLADAKDLKMDVAQFRSCVESHKYKDAIDGDLLEARRIGADGTPAFVIGKSTPEGVDGELMVGAQPLVEFERRLKALETK
jgi:protein-disulfide isomerase